MAKVPNGEEKLRKI